MAALKQEEQTRRDDIEAWLYMVVEWTAGQLPWRKLKGPEKDEVLKYRFFEKKNNFDRIF